MRAIELEVPGAQLALLADRAVFWPGQNALLVADTHFGKAATFRAHAVPVPGGTTANDLQRLSVLLQQTGAAALYILGDMWHAKEGFATETLRAIAEWRAVWESVSVTLVMGNHDRKCGALPEDLAIENVPEPFQLGPLLLVHDPKHAGGAYSLAGHVHPCVRLSGSKQSHRFPCFWFGPEVGVLPAFGSFTGCASVQAVQGDRVFVTAEGDLFEC